MTTCAKADRFGPGLTSTALAIAFALAVVLTAALPCHAGSLGGKVFDESTKLPIEDAIVTMGESIVRTDHNGRFEISGIGDTIGFRAYGYLRTSRSAAQTKEGAIEVGLKPFKPKALYLSFYGIGSSSLREAGLDLAEKTELNAIVVDVKGDRGMVAFKSSTGLAHEAGAQRTITIPDARALVDRLHRAGLYAVARIVVFKDDPLARARPELAVKRANGSIYLDRERLAWTDPFKPEVWDYNIAIAIEAAQIGFDEIQFDYVRFPDAKGLVFSRPANMAGRLEAVSGFLGEAYRRLTPYNVYVAADIFGYVMWNLDDTHIGQRLEELSPVVDYISPMLYPSCFQFGIPGYRLPVAHPYEIVFLSLQNGRERSGIPSIRFRPWLQAFRDYAFDRREFTATEIRAQITAAEKFGADGWMLWNPRNRYTADGLRVEGDGCGRDE